MSFKIVGPNHYESDAGDQITVTVQADGVPFSVGFGPHSSGPLWTIVKPHSQQDPEEIRTFVMPAVDDHYTITYGFGLNPPDGAHYNVTVAGVGGQDGPFEVRPGAFSTVSLQYFFDAAAAAKLTAGLAAKKKSAKKKAKSAKKKTK